ncbi:hypothetical protein [Lentzea terrae]|uniref:hypothetical protein n=1 Tax=Lentzea terrae TaxID=2200761 RepID=UPI000DD3FB1B|nr:hypothetical protein [Lentzea terrae]
MTIRLDAVACNELRPHEVVVVDWHVTGMCCADSGEFSVRVLRRGKLHRGLRAVDAMPSGAVYAHPTAWAHLAGRDVTVSCRRIGPIRWFTTDLPPDAGLRACMGRLPPS